MPRYFFHLRDGRYGWFDPEGVHLPDESAAIAHCRRIAIELMKNREGRVRHWRIHVHDANGMRIHESRFIDEDATLKLLDPSRQEKVKLLCERCHALQDLIEAAKRTREEARTTMARARGKPTLIIDN